MSTITAKMVSAQAVDALFGRALEHRLTPAGQEALRVAGLDLGARRQPSSYGPAQWRTFLRMAAEHLYAGSPQEEAYASLGERFMDGYLDGLWGRTMAAMARVAGPRRTLARTAAALRSLFPGADVQLQAAPGCVVVQVDDVLAPHPGFTAGLLRRVVEAAGGVGVAVEAADFDGAGCTYRVRWQEAPSATAGADEGASRQTA